MRGGLGLAAALLLAGCSGGCSRNVVPGRSAEAPSLLPAEAGCEDSVALTLAWQLRNRLGWSDDGYRITDGRVWIWYANEDYALTVGTSSNVSPNSNSAQFSKECRAVLYRAVGAAQRNRVAAAL